MSSSSGRNQAQESSGRSLVQALSRAAVPVSLPIRLPLLLIGKNGGVHLAYRSRYKLQRPSLHNIQKLFRRLSHIGQTDCFDRLENFLYQFTRCLCYNLFHGDVPHFRSFLLWLTNFTTKGASPLSLFAAPSVGGTGLAISPGINLH